MNFSNITSLVLLYTLLRKNTSEEQNSRNGNPLTEVLSSKAMYDYTVSTIIIIIYLSWSWATC
jgi:hypothetical protein